MTEENVFSFDHVRQIEKLKELVGGLDECKRLGFIFTDEDGIQEMSVAGMGFLLSVVAKNVKTVAEAFAAGYQIAHDEMDDQKEA